MFMLRKTHDAAMALHDKELESLRDRLAGAIGRNLSAQLRIKELKPLADKYTAKLERDREYQANKKRAAK